MQSHQPPPPHHHSLPGHLAAAGTATFFAHPLRVTLNRASFYSTPWATLADVYSKGISGLLKGLNINFVRGTMASGIQAHVKSEFKHRYHDEPKKGLLAGLAAASLIGTIVAVIVETPFMRKGEIPVKLTTLRPPLYKFNKPLGTFFFLREAGFSTAVFAAEDMPRAAHYSTLLVAAWLTAGCHKLAMIEATKDVVATKFTVPDYSKGFLNVFKNMATGGVYTHPALQTIFAHPVTRAQMAANLLYAPCGPNIFGFRLAYLAAFSELFRRAKHSDTIKAIDAGSTRQFQVK